MSTDIKPVALQLYTLRERLDESKESFMATMKQVADIGYKGVEGGQGNAAAFGLSVADYKSLLDDLGLQAVSGPAPGSGCRATLLADSLPGGRPRARSLARRGSMLGALSIPIAHRFCVARLYGRAER